jgi:hypothetical protein
VYPFGVSVFEDCDAQFQRLPDTLASNSTETVSIFYVVAVWKTGSGTPFDVGAVKCDGVTSVTSNILLTLCILFVYSFRSAPHVLWLVTKEIKKRVPPG